MFSSENSLLLVETFAFSNYHTTVRLWNLESGEQTNILSFDSFTKSISFNYKDHLLATSIKTEDGNSQIKIWDVEKKEQSCNISQGMYAKFSQKNNVLAVSNGQDSVSLWNIANCQKIKMFTVDIGLNSFAINPDGSLLVFGTNTGDLNIISTITGEAVKKLDGLLHYTNVIEFSPDGRFLMTLSYDPNLDGQTLIIWQVADQSLEPIIISPEMLNPKTPLDSTQIKP